MIFATELRIGNLVCYHKQPNHQLTVVSELIIDILAHPERFDPIPLTAEVLEKSGFENDWEDRWSNNLVELLKSEHSEGYRLLNGEERTHWDAVYKYVHELQNLYFALTGGQELKIKI